MKGAIGWADKEPTSATRNAHASKSKRTKRPIAQQKSATKKMTSRKMAKIPILLGLYPGRNPFLNNAALEFLKAR